MGPFHYGDMHGFNISIPINVSVINTWYPIASGLNSSDTLGITFDGSHTLTIAQQGVYKLTLSCSVECGAANQLLAFTYTINGTASTNVESQCEQVSSNRPISLYCSDINKFAAGDAITLVLGNKTAINNLTVLCCTLTIIRID